MNRRIAWGLVMALLSSFAVGQRPQLSPDEAAIADRASHLRGLPDEKRAVETKALAKAILALPRDGNRLMLAFELSNLATEGDFGRDTLQLVTDALVKGVVEADPTGNEMLAPAYAELAQLAAYEGMRVHLKSAPYARALAELKRQDAIRGSLDFTLQDIQGHTWNRKSLKGKVVLVNFWATWCPPCRKEMPDLNALYAKFKDKGFVILAISDEKEETVKSFIKKMGYSYPILLDPGRRVNTLYGVEGIPKSFIYGRDGKLVAETIDMRTRGQFLKLLAKANLKSAP